MSGDCQRNVSRILNLLDGQTIARNNEVLEVTKARDAHPLMRRTTILS